MGAPKIGIEIERGSIAQCRHVWRDVWFVDRVTRASDGHLSRKNIEQCDTEQEAEKRAAQLRTTLPKNQ